MPSAFLRLEQRTEISATACGALSHYARRGRSGGDARCILSLWNSLWRLHGKYKSGSDGLRRRASSALEPGPMDYRDLAY